MKAVLLAFPFTSFHLLYEVRPEVVAATPGRPDVAARAGACVRGKPPSSPSEAALQVIPVIDLLRGQVVRARMGDRASYRPLESPLSPTSDPIDVVRGLLSVYPFPTLYVADLDAIQRQRRQFPDAAPHPRRVSGTANVGRQRRGRRRRDRGSYRRRSRRARHWQRIAA